MTVLELIAVGLLASLVVYVAIFLIGARKDRAGWRTRFSSYLRHLVASAAVAVTLMTIVVFGVTAFTGSAQGPLSLVFLAPLALILGGLIGAIIWLLR